MARAFITAGEVTVWLQFEVNTHVGCDLNQNARLSSVRQFNCIFRLIVVGSLGVIVVPEIRQCFMSNFAFYGASDRYLNGDRVAMHFNR